MADEKEEPKVIKSDRSGKLVYDQELQAMSECCLALDGLTSDAKYRVAAWLVARTAPFIDSGLITFGTADEARRP